MKVWRAILTALLATACTTSPKPEMDQSTDPLDIILHSDLPLWLDYQDESMSPHHFTDETSFGCVSELLFGDWKLTYHVDSGGYQEDPVWWRVTNYGVFHCGAMFRTGPNRDDIDNRADPGFAVNLGIDPQTKLHLWVWEIGLKPGSSYLALAATDNSDSKHYMVLDPDCSAGEARKADGMLSSWRTDYCNVPDQNAMRAIVRAAASRPAIGTLDLVGEAPDSKN